MEDAYEKGRKAYKEEKSLEDCPYPVGSPEVGKWVEGWLDESIQEEE